MYKSGFGKDEMNKLFKDIRHGDIEAVRAAIEKNVTAVNEV